MTSDLVVEPFQEAYSDELETVMNYQTNATDTRRGPVAAAREANDPVTEDLAVTVLADEEAHRTKCRGFQKEYQNG